jgi:hypothetical protein
VSDEVEPPMEWEGQRVLAVVDEWRVVDRWWTDSPIDRVYFEIELQDLNRVVVYKEGEGEWKKG